MIKTCYRCGKEFDTENCETYADIQYEIHHVSKHNMCFSRHALCRECEDHFNIFMGDLLEEHMKNGQTS